MECSGSGKDTFSFVHYVRGTAPKDPRVKELVRRQAMKNNALVRKQKGGYARLNPIQLPAWLLEPQMQGEPANAERSRQFLDTIPAWSDGHDGYGEDQEPDSVQLAAKRAAMLEGALRWRAGYKPRPVASFRTGNLANYSLLNLTNPLTLPYAGISTLSNFRPEADCIGVTLTNLPEYANKRLLSFVPSLYGHMPAVTYACDSVVSRLEQLIYSCGQWSPERDVAALEPYTKAIMALQKTIDDESLRVLPETLCAILLLGFFELLHGGSLVDSWLHHAGGAAHLIELRGPRRFRTDFELSLFMTHAGAIITEALLTGKACFLHHEDWQLVLQAAIRNDPVVPPDQKRLAIDLWASLSKAPNLMQSVKDLILNPKSSERRDNLVQRLTTEHDQLKRWLALAEQYQYGVVLNRWHTLTEGATALLQLARVREQPISWRVLIGTYSLNLLVTLRLLFALAPLQFSQLESMAQSIATSILLTVADLDSSENDRLVCGLFNSQTLWMSKAVLSTRDCWGGSVLRTGKSGMLEGWRFEAWIYAITGATQGHPNAYVPRSSISSGF